MDIPVGASHAETVMVDGTNVASAVGSGLVDVFATPMMIALVELTAARCLEKRLDAGVVSVGTHIDIAHSSATPIAMRVTALVTVAAVDGRKVDFDVVVNDEAGEVGRGRHTRFLVDREKFMAKVMEKKKRPAK